MKRVVLLICIALSVVSCNFFKKEKQNANVVEIAEVDMPIGELSTGDMLSGVPDIGIKEADEFVKEVMNYLDEIDQYTLKGKEIPASLMNKSIDLKEKFEEVSSGLSEEKKNQLSTWYLSVIAS